jgi:hypothetical protein
MTWSVQSHPSGIDIETISPAAFTIEASFKPTYNVANGFHTIVGRDGRDVVTGAGAMAPLYFSTRPNGVVAIQFADRAGYRFDAVSANNAVTTGKWYHMAGVSDGSTLSLYLNDVAAGTGYQLVTQTPLTGSIDTRLAIGNGSGGDWVAGTWTVARGLYNGGHVDRFLGNIDEVRISDTALSVSQFLFSPPTAQAAASKPNPADKKTNVAPDVILNWAPGQYAAKHNVYFGTTSAEVTAATTTNHPNVQVSLNQDANTYDPPGTLNFTQTYYWRVDEVNAPPTSTVYPGSVWSFTTEPVASQISNISTTASSYMLNMEPTKTTDGSGINTANDQHGTDSTTMWLSDSTPQPTWIKYDLGKVYKLYEMWVWNSNQTIESSIGLGIKGVKVEYSTDGTNWTQLSSISEFAQAPGTANYVHQLFSLGSVTAQYVRITALSNWKGFLPQYGLSEVRFFYIPVQARDPNPTNGQTGVALNPVLSWKAGRGAVSHKLYFSTSRPAVENGTFAPINISGSGSSVSYGPLSLDLGKTYYWKVDEVNNATTWPGETWSFSTLGYFTVEGFEDYNNSSPKRPFQTWLDGVGYSADQYFPVPYPGNGTGAAVGHDIWTPGTTYTNIMERMITHGGTQSLPLYYNNTVPPYYSETERTFATSQNWTLANAKTLTLYFYGDPNNNINEPMWVRLTDQSGANKKITYGKSASEDVNNLIKASWSEWNIALADFGVNSVQIKKIAIGFSDTGAASPRSSGKVYIDDIRLYPTRCLASRTKPTGDLNNDCAVDYNDIDILANAWLSADRVIATTAPAATGLVGHWKFDDGSGTTAVDSSGGAHNGTLNDASRWVSAGRIGGALRFDGSDDYVDLPIGSVIASLNSCTFATWVNYYNIGGGWQRIFDFGTAAVTGSNPTIYMFLTPRNGTTNVMRFGITTTGNAAGAESLLNAPSVFASGWHHVAVAIDGVSKNMQLYLDGVSIVSGTTATLPSALDNTTQNWLGRSQWSGDARLNGALDDFRIYNKALSGAEVAYLADMSPGDGQLHVPVASVAELYSAEPAGSQKVNFNDYAVLATTWLEEKLWP